MVEYAGVLVVVSVVIALMATLALKSFGPTLARDIECLVQKIVGQGGCAAPPAYPVSSSVKTVGYDARGGIVDGGHSYTVTLTKLSDGTSTITVTNNAKLGVSAQVGADVELGPLASAGADASIGGGGYGGQSETWTFPSWSKGQSAYGKISQGSALGLGAHDAVSSTAGQFPVLGSLATGLFDSITGASGAPDQGSLPSKYLTSTSTGGGLQGSGEAGAHVDAGPLQASVGGSIDANYGIRHINYGDQKGDWQVVGGLDANLNGGIANWLFGMQADAAGNVQSDAVVTYSPSGAPLSLEVTAYGDGVWGVSSPTDARVDVPGSSSQAGGSSTEGGKSSGGEGGKEPLLTIENSTSGGSGAGSVFTGTLDLRNNPQAVQDVTALLEGDTSTLPDLINQMNTNGTETIQTYHITRSSSTVGGGLSAGAGFGGHLNDGSSNATYNPPKTRDHGGKWHDGQ